MSRSRSLQTALLLLTLGTGLLWRSGYLVLSPFAFKYGGDALWALAVFWGAGWLGQSAGTVKVAFAALGLSWAVEVSQLWHPAWLDAVRSTRLGHLVLGSTFNWPDLVAYAAGICLGALIEMLGWRWAQKKPGLKGPG